MKHSLISSLTHNLSGQLLSRIISFGINMYLLRRIDGDVLGLVNVSLMLYYSTIVFLVREPFRKVLLSSDVSLSVAITHMWFAPLLCPLVALLLYLCFWLPFTTVPNTSLVQSYGIALSAFAFSAWLESFAEPYVILLLRFGMDAQYAIAQGFLVVIQRVFVLILIMAAPLMPVYAFCCAQILSSFCYFVLCIYLLNSGLRYLRVSARGFNMISLYPTFPKTLSKENLSMLGTFTVHSIFKQALTDGTGYVLTFTNFFSLSDQAVFDAVDKLGSLVARIIFAPLEHSAYLYFSACLRRTASAEDQNEVDVKKAVGAMSGLLHIVVVIGTVIFTFAMPYSPIAIRIYGGHLLVTHGGAGILRLYCLYIIVIAINGITECFAMATMSKKELFSHGWFLFFSSPVHILSSSVLSYFIGAYGLILANIINMLMRIAYSWRHIRRFLLGQISFVEALPNFSTILILLFSLAITSLSFLIFGGVGGIIHSSAHIAVGGALFIFVINHIYQNDMYIAKFLNDQLSGAHVD